MLARSRMLLPRKTRKRPVSQLFREPQPTLETGFLRVWLRHKLEMPLPSQHTDRSARKNILRCSKEQTRAGQTPPSCC